MAWEVQQWQKGSLNRRLQVEKLPFGLSNKLIFCFFVQYKMKGPLAEMAEIHLEYFSMYVKENVAAFGGELFVISSPYFPSRYEIKLE